MIIKSQYKEKCKIFKFNYSCLQSKYNHLLMTFHCAIFSRNRSSLENGHKSIVTINKLLIHPSCWNWSLTMMCRQSTTQLLSTGALGGGGGGWHGGATMGTEKSEAPGAQAPGSGPGWTVHSTTH